MEKRAGRPPVDDKKVHPPRIVMRISTIEAIELYALNCGISVSQAFQEAGELLIENINRKKRLNKG